MNWSRGRTIGRGSTATVSAATFQNSGEIFAVKSTNVSQSEHLQREAEILSSLNSPYIIGYRGYAITKSPSGEEDICNLLMEHAPYGTLADAVRKNGGNLDEFSIVRYTRQVLRGLEYIHRNGVVHCDIKGTNVLIGHNGRAKIADFGSAKWIKPGSEPTEPVRGTPAFMSPEAARGLYQSLENDIWAVGCTVIQMATGSPPFIYTGSIEPASVLYRIGYLGMSPVLPVFLSQQARDFLEKCLRREPEDRWTASQLLNHPFLAKSEIQTQQSVSDSPTSVMDCDFWSSEEEEEEEKEEDKEEVWEDLDRRNSCESPSERIGRLLSFPLDGVVLDVCGQDWFMVRQGS